MARWIEKVWSPEDERAAANEATAQQIVDEVFNGVDRARAGLVLL
jgi:hypothetical protein